MAARKKATPKKTTAGAPKKGKKANWGAKESPRSCVKCKSEATVVVTTTRFTRPDRVVRYRKCDECGQRFTTMEVST